MSFVCLWNPAWQTDGDFREDRGPKAEDRTRGPSVPRPELAAILLSCAPHVAVGERGVLWVDARGFSAGEQHALAGSALVLLGNRGVTGTRAAIADTPIAAELAARTGHGNAEKEKEGAVAIVAPGTDRAFVSLFPIAVLNPPQRLEPLLFSIGVGTCGELAVLEHEAIEVRLGAEGVALWRLARADDRRSESLFPPAQRELPHASLDWVEYALKDPMRLLFVINSLIENVCGALIENGSGARELTIEFSLTDRTTHLQPLRSARPTANRSTWIRLARTALDKIALVAAVTGVGVRATRVTGQEARQGDLFDRGFVSAQATEDAVARLVEDQGDVVVVPENSGHPLLDVRTSWKAMEDRRWKTEDRRPRAEDRGPKTEASVPHLQLQLSPSPQLITVETAPRRDHFVPARYRDAGGWHEIVQAAGPDRVSGGQCDSFRTYAREYFRCVTNDGALVWLFRDAQEKTGGWYLHGWWD
jgi:protein ImuB